MNFKRWVMFLWVSCTWLFVSCSFDETKIIPPSSNFLNVYDSVQYIGMQVCKSCHSEIHQTFIKNGMGQSLGPASLDRSDAKFDNEPIVYDEKSDFYYRPYFQDSNFYIEEFRLKDGDTTHKRTEKVSYIIGSGHHTNSHIIDQNGYIFQAPITFYTQKGIWDMAPGFKDKGNERFNRTLETECLTCHNNYPVFQEGSLNKVLEMPSGIECERCHGPGELHARKMLAGDTVNTAFQADLSIVNPKRLSRELQMDLCQRCHLQGTAVLEPQKTFFDFRPGMKLSEIVNVYLPRTNQSDRAFLMASQADRLRLSNCFQNSEMTCLNCHHPHHSVKDKEQYYYREKCIACHKERSIAMCSEDQGKRNDAKNNCIACHMPKAGSMDIPHISITDHNISRYPAVLESENTDNENVFHGLKILTKEKGSNMDMARAYLAFYDKYAASPEILDSAYFYLAKCAQKEALTKETKIHYYFNRNYLDSIIRFSALLPPVDLSDPWTAYRIGEAFFKKGQYPVAKIYFKKACDLLPYYLEFQEKLGVTLLALNDIKASQKVLEFVIQENPKRSLAIGNLGYIEVLNGNLKKGEQLYDRAIALNPDYVQALLNKAAVRILKKDLKTGKDLINRILEIEPGHVQAIQVLGRLQ